MARPLADGKESIVKRYKISTHLSVLICANIRRVGLSHLEICVA